MESESETDTENEPESQEHKIQDIDGIGIIKRKGNELGGDRKRMKETGEKRGTSRGRNGEETAEKRGSQLAVFDDGYTN